MLCISIATSFIKVGAEPQQDVSNASWVTRTAAQSFFQEGNSFRRLLVRRPGQQLEQQCVSDLQKLSRRVTPAADARWPCTAVRLLAASPAALTAYCKLSARRSSETANKLSWYVYMCTTITMQMSDVITAIVLSEESFSIATCVAPQHAHALQGVVSQTHIVSHIAMHCKPCATTSAFQRPDQATTG